MPRPRYIEIGKNAGSDSLARVDLVRLLRGGAVIEGNSGSGKSWLIRKLVESCAATKIAPQWVFDPEDEFSSLREMFDFLLVGPGGEVPADVRTAGLLARRLMEIGVSAVFNLSEMDEDVKQEWIRVFFMAVIDSPRKLWGYTLLYLDEAHIFAPEKGEGTSTASRAVRAMATRGRKRGKRLICATQRPAMFDKTVAAQMPNKAVGMITIDIDQDRAARSLGIRQKDRADFWDEIGSFEPGTFYVRGPAFAAQKTKIDVGKVLTTHPDPGSSGLTRRPSPTPAAIKKILAELKDLPKEAAEEVATVEGLKKRIRELEEEVRLAPKPAGPPLTERIPVPAFKKLDLTRLERMAKKLAVSEGRLAGVMTSHLEGLKSAGDELAQRQQVVVSTIGNLEATLKLASMPEKIRTSSLYGKLGTHSEEREAASPEPMHAGEIDLVKKGDLILAIKAYCLRTGASLIDATRYVNMLKVRLPCNDCGHVHSGPEHGPERQAYVSGKVERIRKPGNGVHHYDIVSAFPAPQGITSLGWRLLGAFASVYPRGMKTRAACTLISVSKRSSAVDLQLAQLRRQALIETQTGETRATTGGAKIAVERGLADLAKKSPQALLDDWTTKLGKTARDILLAIVAAGLGGLVRAQIIERTGKSNKSSGVDLAFAQLKRLGLIEKKDEWFVAVPAIRP